MDKDKRRRFNGARSTFSRAARGLLSKAQTYRVPPDVYIGSIQGFLSALDCPRALTVWILFANNEHGQLSELEFDPTKYSQEDFAGSYRATMLFSKYQGFSLDVDRKQLALTKLLETEHRCKLVNERFRDLSLCPLYQGSTVWLHDAVRRKIASILGPFDVTEFLESANWGPGASTLIKGFDACAANKFQCETGVTRDLSALLTDPDFFGPDGFSPLWSKTLGSGYPQFFAGNRVEFVPKSSRIDRSIAIEPGINLWFQKALGSMLRRRLRQCGVDLNQQYVNQYLAYCGSKTDYLATIDFSSASDSISERLVEELFPQGEALSTWYFMLNTCRSHYGLFPGSKTPVRWNKFSSMGNGFTFELESLIFYAVACCCNEYLGLTAEQSEGTSVYGDDVIIPEPSLPLFSKMSEFYGFTVNVRKSFSSSDFRESCGAHYLRGVDVKPIYLKDRLKDLPSLFRWHNAIRRLSHGLTSCDQAFEKCCADLVASVPKSLRFRIPEHLGDGGFISNLDEACPSRNRNWIEGYNCVHLVEGSIPYPFSGTGLILSSLWALEHQPPELTQGSGRFRTKGDVFHFLRCLREKAPMKKWSKYDYVSRRSFTKLRLTRSVVSTWDDLGPWV